MNFERQYILILVILFCSCTFLQAATIQGRVALENDPDERDFSNLTIELSADVDGARSVIATTVTADDAIFTFEDVKPGAYAVAIRPPLRMSRNDNSPLLGLVIPRETPVVVKEAADAVHVRIVMRQGVSVKGRVLNHRGEPMERVVIASESGTDSYMPRTQDDGTFTYQGLPADTEVQLMAMTAMSAPDEQGKRYYHTIQIRFKTGSLNGDTVDVGDIQFENEPDEANITGNLTDPKGQPLPGIRAVPVERDDERVAGVLVSQKGKIVGTLPPGKYHVLSGKDKKRIATFEVTEGKVTEVNITKPAE